MLKKRLITLTLTALLIGFAFLLEYLYHIKWIADYPLFARAMLLSTATFTLGGCILQTLGHLRTSMVIGAIVFFILCICFFYSVGVLDLIVFMICMWILLRRASKLCDCMSDKCDTNSK